MSPVLSVRLTDDEAGRIDRIRTRLAASVAPIRVSRSDALRAVLVHGIAALERKGKRRKR